MTTRVVSGVQKSQATWPDSSTKDQLHSAQYVNTHADSDDG